MKFAFALVLASTLGLTACAEINKPITPGDSWPERATSLDSGVYR